VSDAHNKMDMHIEQSDEWLHEFDARMLAHGKLATIMYHTLNELKELTAIQQARIAKLELQIVELQDYKQIPVISSDSTSTSPSIAKI
jgi:hypothetical protein